MLLATICQKRQMWNNPHLTAGCSVLLLCLFANAQVPSFEEILKTNQYLIVSQQDAATIIETEIPVGKCPQAFINPRTNPPRAYKYVGFHLIRDTENQLPPKVMVIKQQQHQLSINLFSINATAVFNNQGSRKTAVFIDKTSHIPFSHVDLKHVNLVNSLFDSTSRMLYLDFSTPGKLTYKQYYVQGLFGASLTATYVTGKSQTSPIYRYDWTEDPYAGKFYYKETVDNEVWLFEVPMGALIPTILEGEFGKKIGRLTSEGQLVGATGAAFFSVDKESKDDWTLTSSLVPVDLGPGIRCRSHQSISSLPKFFKMTVIRDNDYCMLRDGSEYNREKCEAERTEYLISTGMLNDSDGAMKWLLVVCMVLFMLIVILFVYIYWLRSTFISDFDRSHQNEYETEASLFVAKQRSFPSAYQDPALLDVSVDKWN